MRLFLAFLCAIPLGAQCISPTSVEVTDHKLRWQGETDTVGTAARTATWYDSSSPFGGSLSRRSIDYNAANASEATRYDNVAELGPATKYYVDFRVSDASGSYVTDYSDCQATLCPDGAGVQTYDADVTCEDIDPGAGTVLIPTITTAADGGGIAAPTAPSLTRTLAQNRTSPTITGSTTNLSDCTTFQAALNDHGDSGTKDTALDHEIVLAPGLFCRPELESSGALGRYTFPAKTGVGVTVIRCGWTGDDVIPDGVQYTPGLRNANSCGFEANRSFTDANSPTVTNGEYFSAACSTAGCSSGWRFEEIVFDPGDWELQDRRQIAVSSVDTGTGVITLASDPTGVFSSSMRGITYNLPGITNASDNSDVYARAPQVPNITAVLTSSTIRPSSVTGWTGSYSGGGYVQSITAFPISSCTAIDADTADCTVASGVHGMGTYAAKSISDLTSGVVTLGTGHGMRDSATLKISGNSACDGRYDTSAFTSTTVTLHNSTCSGTGGTVQRLHMARFFELAGTGATALTGFHPVEYTSSTNVRVYGVDLQGLTITDGGVMPGQATQHTIWFDMRYVKNWTFSQTLWVNRPPFRWSGLINMSSDNPEGQDQDGAFIDSYIDGYNTDLPVAPSAGSLDDHYPANGQFTAFTANSAKGVRIHNVTSRDNAGFLIFSDINDDFGMQDIEISKVIIEFRRKPGDDNIMTFCRHAIEAKAAQRILIQGLHIKGWPVCAVGNSYAIYWKSNGYLTDRKTWDIDMQDLWFEDTAAGIGIDVESPPAKKINPWWPIERVRVDNWLADRMPWQDKAGTCGNDSCSYQPTGPFSSQGGAFNLGGPVEDIQLTRFTIRDPLRGVSNLGSLFLLGGDRGNGVQIDDGIVVFNGTISIDAFTGNLTPTGTDDDESGFRAFYSWAGSEDSYSWFGTASKPICVIPCLEAEDDSSPDYNSTNNAHTNSTSAFACSTCTKWDADIVAGSADAQSCTTREALGLAADLSGISTCASRGANIDELYDALGYTIEPSVNASTAAISYTVPSAISAQACTVDHGTSATYATFTRATDSGSGTNRSVTASGYSPGQTIHYRVLCPDQQQAWGSFVKGS